MKTFLDYFFGVFFWCCCKLGFHHMHDLKEKEAVIKAPPGVVINGEYCCRCHHIEILSAEIDGVKSKAVKINGR